MEARSQRWLDRRQKFVPDNTFIDTSEYSVDIIHCYKTAKPFVQEHHYSGTFPATRLSCGLFRNGKGGRSSLVGVCSFSVPMNNAAIPLHTGLKDHLAAADLGRLVLLDDVAANGESWFVRRAFKLLRQEKPQIEAIIAYSDPVRRISETGEVIMPGHCGMIYQALSATLRGRSTARQDSILPNGRIISPRAISKIRNQETGSVYAENQILEAGADPRRLFEDPSEWIKRLQKTGFLKTRKHPGNLVYTFSLTRNARKASLGKPEYPFPKKDNSVISGDVTYLPIMQRCH